MRILGLESSVERKSVAYAEGLGMLSFKLTPAGQRGWMDRLFITLVGEHFYMEFKREGKGLEKLQEHRRWQLQQRKCTVYGPVDNLETAKEIIDYHAKAALDAARVPREGD